MLIRTVGSQWYRDSWGFNPEDIPEEHVIMNEISPALHADLITKPLFVIQGANDPRVIIDEADQMVKSLRERGVEVSYMVNMMKATGLVKRITDYTFIERY